MANAVTSFRVNITASFAGGYVGAGEIRVKNSSGAYISLDRATITASSTYSDWYPSKLKDGSTAYGTNTWASNWTAFPEWVNVSFSAAVDAAIVEVINYDIDSNEAIRTGSVVATHSGGSTTSVSFTRSSSAANAVSSHTIPALAVSTTAIGRLPSVPVAGVPQGIAATLNNAICSLPSVPVAGLPQGIARTQTVAIGSLPSVPVAGVPQGIATVHNSAIGRLPSVPVSDVPQGIAATLNNAICRLPSATIAGVPQGTASTQNTAIGRLHSAQVAGVPQGIAHTQTVAIGRLTSVPIAGVPQGQISALNHAIGRVHSVLVAGVPQGVSRTQTVVTAPTRTPAYWLRIETMPSLAFYAGQRPNLPSDIGLSMPRLSALLPIRRPLSVPQLYNAEISNASADIDNADGAISRLWTTPPVRVPASMYLGSMKLMDGVITSVKIGATIALDFDAGLRAPITDTLPLRTSIVWGAFKDVKALAWVYGRVTLEPVPYDSTMRMFHVADHVIQGIDAVKIDGVPVQAYVLHHAEDSTGQTVAFLELATALEDGKTLSVTLRGRMHPTTGALLTSPAEVLHDLIVNRLGITMPIDALDKLRSDGAGVELGGVFDNADMQIKEAIDTVVQSFGGAWSFGSEDAVIFDPWADDTDKPTAVTPTLRNCANMALESNHSNLATVVRVVYDYDYSKGSPRRALQIEAPEPINEYGRIEREWQAPWLKSPRQAELLARRLLGHLARPQWQATWDDATQSPPSPGDFAELSNHVYSTIQGRHRLLVADINPDTRMTQCKIVAPIGDVPRMELKALSTAFEPDMQVVEVAYQNGVATFTVRDQNGNPLQGASVTLNGKVTRITDSAGRVSFTTPRGIAKLLIKAQGMADNNVEVTV